MFFLINFSFVLLEFGFPGFIVFQLKCVDSTFNYAMVAYAYITLYLPLILF
jgi:hypothetical protein